MEWIKFFVVGGILFAILTLSFVMITPLLSFLETAYGGWAVLIAILLWGKAIWIAWHWKR